MNGQHPTRQRGGKQPGPTSSDRSTSSPSRGLAYPSGCRTACTFSWPIPGSSARSAPVVRSSTSRGTAVAEVNGQAYVVAQGMEGGATALWDPETREKLGEFGDEPDELPAPAGVERALVGCRSARAHRVRGFRLRRRMGGRLHARGGCPGRADRVLEPRRPAAVGSAHPRAAGRDPWRRHRHVNALADRLSGDNLPRLLGWGARSPSAPPLLPHCSTSIEDGRQRTGRRAMPATEYIGPGRVILESALRGC